MLHMRFKLIEFHSHLNDYASCRLASLQCDTKSSLSAWKWETSLRNAAIWPLRKWVNCFEASGGRYRHHHWITKIKMNIMRNHDSVVGEATHGWLVNGNRYVKNENDNRFDHRLDCRVVSLAHAIYVDINAKIHLHSAGHHWFKLCQYY